MSGTQTSGPAPPINRTTSAAAGNRRRLLSRRQLVMLAGALGVAGALIVYLQPRAPKSREDQNTPAVKTAGHVAVWTPPPPPLIVDTPPKIAPVVYNSPPPSIVVATPPVAPVPGKVTRPAMLAFNVPALPADMKPQIQNGAGGANGVTADATHVIYKGSSIPGVKAGPMGDTSLTLMPGLLRCTLDTAINSDLAGPFICHLPGDVMSDSGVVLMDAQTRIIGNYQSKLSQGEHRLMAIAGVAYTPGQPPCAVPLGTPMADNLGETGIPGEVKTYAWERFGGAVMLSLVDSALRILQSSVSKGGNTYLSFQSGGISSLAQDILHSTINIQPTTTVNQGSDVALWITAPINFDACWKLRTRN